MDFDKPKDAFQRIGKDFDLKTKPTFKMMIKKSFRRKITINT
jgi:hypothetical protein